MSKQREALEIALHALEEIATQNPADWEFDICVYAKNLLREALAEQPEPKSVINFAIEAGVIDSADINSIHISQQYIDDLTRFARLVIEQEREACAKLCEAYVGLLDDTGEGRFWAAKCAETIRKGRGKI